MQMRLIDGRNRRIACRALGMVPGYVLLDGHDPIAYIVSANITRRHLSKGQRAVVVAKICSFSEQTQRQLAEQNSLSTGLVGSAATVLKYALDLANAILMGHLSLDNAYEEAQAALDQRVTQERREKMNTLAPSSRAGRYLFA